MADNIVDRIKNSISGRNQIASKIDQQVNMYANQRRKHEQVWYDNNFFDDGYHFRYVSRTTGKIVDLSDNATASSPMRAIPKASRQIRGVANLLLAGQPHPVVYPSRVTRTAYPNPQDYQSAYMAAKIEAQKIGHWITDEWDNQELEYKLVELAVLASKHSVSFLQVWPDAVDEKIKTQVWDAFDIYVAANLNNIYDSPSIVKAVPKLISQIKANENFYPEAVAQLSPDNKYASSEVKDAYMKNRFGSGQATDEGATIIQKEAFIKEYLDDDNMGDIKRRFPRVVGDKQKGDMVMRHVFTAGGVTLLDEYVDLPEYPFVAFQLEPGPIYQTPLMNRFIPANKTLDMLSSRIEQWANTMVSGGWLKRKGENFEITNVAGGAIYEYETVPPTQAQMANLPSALFQFIQMLEGFIEEQGASTSALGQLPQGVKSGIAIESLKATEYANLKIPTDMMKLCVKQITQRLIEIAANYFINTQTVYILEKGEPSYFDIIGEQGIRVREENGIQMQTNPAVIKKDMKVDIEIETGLGFTMEGKRKVMQEILNYMVQLAQGGLVDSEVIKTILKVFFDTFKFGGTQDIMEALDNMQPQQGMDEQTLMKMKIAMAEVLKDTGVAGPDAEKRQIDTTKMGVAQTISDLKG